MKKTLTATIEMDFETNGTINDQVVLNALIVSVFQQGTNTEAVAVYTEGTEPVLTYHVAGVRLSDVLIQQAG